MGGPAGRRVDRAQRGAKGDPPRECGADFKEGRKGVLGTSRGGSSGAEGMASAKARRLVWLEGRGSQGGAGPKYRAVTFSPGRQTGHLQIG